MVRQIGPHFQQPSMVALEERVLRLENVVTLVAEAVRVLARGLEAGPMAEPDARTVTQAARQAHDLLLTLRMPNPSR